MCFNGGGSRRNLRTMDLQPNVQCSKMKIAVAREITAVVVNLRYYRRGLAPNRYNNRCTRRGAGEDRAMMPGRSSSPKPHSFVSLRQTNLRRNDSHVQAHRILIQFLTAHCFPHQRSTDAGRANYRNDYTRRKSHGGCLAISSAASSCYVHSGTPGPHDRTNGDPCGL